MSKACRVDYLRAMSAEKTDMIVWVFLKSIILLNKALLHSQVPVLDQIPRLPYLKSLELTLVFWKEPRRLLAILVFHISFALSCIFG
ncbi:hypothetical protein EDD18DRAFT_579493 [Armillaria luteobubalina]|uniref:Uncharacterized protein n=1 Tax=Armillaria luteobubalina TaxID=153913 RepID=A0AA39T875_9AGAR|nr:hypothetical protein EDD18DRAFT_579493 [Armillaria luteobubalina]